MKKLFTTALILTVFGISAVASEFNDSLRYRAEIGTTFSAGDHTPFWMVNDHYGFSGIKKNNAWIRAGIFHDIDKEKRFSWGAGVDLGVAVNFERVFIPQQIYAEVKYRCLNAMIGQKEMEDDVVTSDLASGAMTVSCNARPIPQFRIGIFDYADFWGCKGWFAVKGYLAYGMFTDNAWLKDWVSPNSAYVLNTLYATRAIYFRGGDARQFPLVGEVGMRMDSQFGGTIYYAEKDGVRATQHFPTNLKAWIKGMIPLHGDETTSVGEQMNVQGNFLGNWSFSLGWYDPKGWSVKAYYQHFFEDHSQMTFDYPWKDGYWGVEGKLPKNPYVSEIVAEYLTTRDSSGPVYFDHNQNIPYQVSGTDGYYTHFMYQSWNNYGMTIGNPFLISPVYNSDHDIRIRHNRIRAWNVGLKGAPSQQVDWKLRMSGIRSWGSYSAPTATVLHDFSMLAEVKYHPLRLKGWEGSFSVAFDKGNLIGDSFGIGISIAKVGFIHF